MMFGTPYLFLLLRIKFGLLFFPQLITCFLIFLVQGVHRLITLVLGFLRVIYLKNCCASPLCERGFDIESVKQFFEPFLKFFLSCPRYAAQRNVLFTPFCYNILYLEKQWTIIDWITRGTVGNGENGIRWKFTSKLCDLDFADDTALISSTKQQIQNKTTRLEEEARRVGLKVSTKKTKTTRINARNQDKIVVNEIDIEEVDEFTYLGAKVCKEGGGMKDMKNR